MISPDRLTPEERKYLKVCTGILLLFAIGLVFFFTFSEGLPDGLEKAMEEGKAEESQLFESPLEYGEDYPHALVSGIMGFFIVLFSTMLYGRFMGRKEPGRASGDKE